MKRNPNIDILRIISCVAVVGLHSFQENLNAINIMAYRACGFAVPAFFVASGYFLASKEISPKHTWIKIVRILGIIFFWNVLVWIFLMPERFLDLRSLNIELFWKNLYGGFIQQGRLWHFWYFAALMLVYTVAPILSRLFKENSNQRMLLVWATLLSVGLCLQLLSEFVFHESLQRRVLQPLRLWTWLQYFLLGGLLRKYQQKWQGKTGVAIIILLCSSVLVQVYQYFASMWINVPYGEAFYDSIVTILWVFSIFVYVMNLNMSNKAIRIVENLAPCTMGVYIIHPIIIRYIKKVYFPDTFARSVIVFVTLILLSFSITFVMRKIPGLKKLVNL